MEKKPTTAITPFEPQSIEEADKLSKLLAGSALLPDALRGKPGDVLVALITGRELGLSPMQSIRGMHVIKGKAVMSADLMVALVQKHRDTCEWFRMVESTDTKAVYETKRHGHPEPVRLTWTLEQAKNAGLLTNDNWKKHPAAMLRARCSSALARAVYPDLMMGVYDPDEAQEFAPAPPRTVGNGRTPQAAVPRPASESVLEAEVVAEPHDEATGEVGGPSLCDQIAAQLHEANTAEALRQIAITVPAHRDAGRLTADESKALGDLFRQRQAALANGAAANGHAGAIQ